MKYPVIVMRETQGTPVKDAATTAAVVGGAAALIAVYGVVKTAQFAAKTVYAPVKLVSRIRVSLKQESA